MKKLLLSITMLVTFIANAQLPVETFSGTFPPTGWTTAATNAARPWGLTTTLFNAAGQLTYNIDGPSAAINWIATPNDAHLTTPAFSLVGYSDANLTFKAKIGYSYMIAQAAGDLFVQISTNNGATFTDVWTEEDGPWADDGDGDPDTDLYDTQEIIIDMTPYVGNAQVMVRFRYLATDADALSLDDVSVLGTLSNDEFAASKFTTYPNPVNNVVTIANKGNIMMSEVAITDINGRTVKTVKVDNVSEVQLNVSDLNAGVYFMNITSDSGKAVKKFIKN